MRAGYGRGYYGEGQLAPRAPRRRGGWIKFAVVVGVGAVVWYMWPRGSKHAYEPGFGGGDEPKPMPPPLPHLPEGQLMQSAPGTAVDPIVPLDQAAQSRGYPSQKAYEEAVVASARELQDAGAKVLFAPHLQHLTPRLGP